MDRSFLTRELRTLFSALTGADFEETNKVLRAVADALPENANLLQLNYKNSRISFRYYPGIETFRIGLCNQNINLLVTEDKELTVETF